MADPVPAEEKQDDLADALIDALTDYRCFRHEIDNFDDDDLADLKKHLTEAANPALRAARENALEEAAKWHDVAAETLRQPPSGPRDQITLILRDLLAREHDKDAQTIRSLKSPSSATTQENS